MNDGKIFAQNILCFNTFYEFKDLSKLVSGYFSIFSF